MEILMPSPKTLLKLAMFASMLVAVQSADGPARAGEEPGPALQASVAQTSAFAELAASSGNGNGQLQPGIPTEVELVTGDGQQGSAPGRPLVCVDPRAECTK
jgi:hypothetical protein